MTLAEKVRLTVPFAVVEARRAETRSPAGVAGLDSAAARTTGQQGWSKTAAPTAPAGTLRTAASTRAR